MYKHHKVKFLFMSYLFYLLIGIGSFFNAFTFGLDFFQPDTRMSDATKSQVTHKDIFSQQGDDTDLYMRAREFVSKNQVGSFSSTFDQVAVGLNKLYTCNIRSSQVIDILYSDATIRATFAQLSKDQRAFAERPGQFLDACRVLIKCINSTSSQSQQLISVDTAVGLDICRNAVLKRYANVRSQLIMQQSFENSKWDEIFANGSLDDSSFDLMVDIQEIGNLFFTSNKPAQEVLFFKMPQVNKPSLPIPWAGQYGVPSANAQYPWSPTTGTQFIGWEWYPLLQQSGTNSGQDLNGSGIGLPSDKVLQNDSTWAVKWLVDDLRSSSNNWVTNSSSPVQINILQSNQCLLAPEDTVGDVVSPSQIREVTQWIYQSIAQPNLPAIFDAGLWRSGFSGGASDKIGGDVVGSGLSQDEQVEELNESLNDNLLSPGKSVEECINSCNINFPPNGYQETLDNLVCKARCTCDKVGDPNGLYQLQFCFVPGQSEPIIPGKKVQSVDEILTELNVVLKTLKESGNLIKHTKTKEVLDTSMSRINLWNVFHFDFVVKFKPIFNVKPTKEVQQKQQEQNKALKNYFLRSSDLSTTQEKNKYLLLANPQVEQGGKEIFSTSFDASKPADWKQITQMKSLNKEKALQVFNILQKQTASAVVYQVGQFVLSNGNVRQQISDSINEVRQTSQSLTNKISQ